MTAESKTDGSGTTDTPPATPAAQPAPTPASDTGNVTGAEARIHGLTAQVERHKGAASDWESKYNDLKTASQTDQEKLLQAHADKAIEVFRLTEYTPVVSERDQYKAILTAQLEMVKQRLPEDKRVHTTVDTLPLAQQYEFYNSLATSLPAPTPNVGASANPVAPAAGKIWTTTEIRAHQSEPGWWEANREDILRAQGDGRYKNE